MEIELKNIWRSDDCFYVLPVCAFQWNDLDRIFVLGWFSWCLVIEW